MLPKRSDRDGDSGIFPRDTVDTTTAAATLAAADHAKAGKSHEEGMSLFWRVFGGTILSICALVAVTLYNNLTGSIAELRAEIAKVNEHRAELLKKDEFNTRLTTNYQRLQDVNAQANALNASLTSARTEVDGVKERVGRNATELDAVKKDTAAVLDAVKKDVAALEALKERVATLSADAKAAREEYLTLRQDVNKNQAYDQERKAHRDEQHKEIEKTLKELQAGLTACQLKLARLEGKADAKKPADKATPAKPGDGD